MIFLFLFEFPINIAKLNELEKDYRNADGSLHYHSHVRLPLNPGLPRFLAKYRDKVLERDANSNIVFLIVHKSEVPNNWGDIGGLGLRFLRQINIGNGIDFGHVQWGWSCKIQNHRIDGASGYTGEQTDQGIALAFKGWGVTPALMTFNDGYFETPWSVQVKAQVSSPSNFLVLTVLTSNESCENFLASYQDLRFKKRIQDFQLVSENSEFNVDLKEGINCSTIAAVLFSNIKGFPMKVFKESQEMWELPIHYFGLPATGLPSSAKISTHWLNQVSEVGGVSVDIRHTLTSSINSGRKIKVFFLDPQKLFGAIKLLPLILDLRNISQATTRQ